MFLSLDNVINLLDNEYLMTVKLECSDASNYIEVHLGCYDYCDGDVCESQKTVITIQSLTNEKFDYWGIAADQDRISIISIIKNRLHVSYC